MTRRRRISAETAAVLSLFLEHPDRRLYGLEVLAATGLPSGSVYPILIRLENRGILASENEEARSAAIERRKPRRYYCLTPLGLPEAQQALLDWQNAMRARHPLPLGGSPASAAQ